MEIRIDQRVAKQAEAAGKKIQNALGQRILLFRQNPFHPLLHNHPLVGRYRGLRSINITGDWRAIYLEKKTSDGKVLVEFRLFGTHSQLYK